jgi:hypothetical protein
VKLDDVDPDMLMGETDIEGARFSIASAVIPRCSPADRGMHFLV